MSIANRRPELINEQVDAYARSLGFKDAREMDEDWAMRRGYDTDVPTEDDMNDFMEGLEWERDNVGLPF
jgi:hypothetical protein